jgi:hypothetical protein
MESGVAIVKIRLTPMTFNFSFNGQPKTQKGRQCDAERPSPRGLNKLCAAAWSLGGIALEAVREQQLLHVWQPSTLAPRRIQLLADLVNR